MIHPRPAKPSKLLVRCAVMSRMSDLPVDDPEFAAKFPLLGLTFDDVLLLPAESSFNPSDADTTTRLSRRITLRTPLLSLGETWRRMASPSSCASTAKVSRDASLMAGQVRPPLDRGKPPAALSLPTGPA